MVCTFRKKNRGKGEKETNTMWWFLTGGIHHPYKLLLEKKKKEKEKDTTQKSDCLDVTAIFRRAQRNMLNNV